MKQAFHLVFLLFLALPTTSFADTRRPYNIGCDTIFTADNQVIYATELEEHKDYFRYKTCDSLHTSRLIRVKNIRGILFANGEKRGKTFQETSDQGQKDDKAAVGWAITSLLMIFPFGFLGVTLLLSPICAIVALVKANDSVKRTGRLSNKSRAARILACFVLILSVATLMILLFLLALL